MVEAEREEQAAAVRRWPAVLAILAAALVVVIRLTGWRLGFLEVPAVQAWTTVFVAIVIQAIPFLVFGVLISALIATAVPPSFFARALPKSQLAAVPMASLAGGVLPGCECASVPIARRLISRGVPPAAALAFLLSAPAINPIVIVATAVAFPGEPRIVLGRVIASVVVSVTVGLVWTKLGRPEWTLVRQRKERTGSTKLEQFAAEARHDFLQAGGFLVIGGMAAATMNVVVPQQVLDTIGGSVWLGVLTLGVLAVILAICSEADAFIAASLTQFSPTAQLTFMVIGPMVDVKLIAMQVGTFGRAFALRFAPLVFGTGIVVTVLVGMVML
ncbi:MAG: permease [Streptosporangiales bacterium]|nr:permease [Streptosporangiales bacterium]